VEPPPAPGGAESRAAHRLVLLLAGLSVVPFVANLGRFRRLYWFGDDWMLLDEIARLGGLRWLTLFFFENFVPVFKALWLGTVLAFHGYLAMLALLWLTHAAGMYLLGRLLLGAGLPVGAAAVAMVTAGLAWSNIETLGWSVQWTSILAVLFFLAALLLAVRMDRRPAGERPGWGTLAVYLTCLAASGLSHGRGVTSGLGLAVFWLLPRQEAGARRGARVGLALLSALPSAAIAAAIFLFRPGADTWGASLPPGAAQKMAAFAGYYWLLNPLFQLVWPGPISREAIVLLGALKVAILALGLWLSRGRARSCLASLVVVDAVTAVLLGLGRHWTGADFAVSWRYQYASLIAFAPALGAAASGVARLALPRWVAVALLAGWACWIGWRWTPETESWSHWRGGDVRTILQSPGDPSRYMPHTPGGITVERARALVERFGLR
jgi:hypothetical protein